ncbi:hypothetical protein ACAX61_12910 [Sphingomonas sp. IW22]
MFARQVKIAGIAVAAALGLSACSDYGYGYGGINAGYGAAYYDDPYLAGGTYGSPYWGWNNGFYYPGTGYYVYDVNRRPFRWNGAQQRYWEGRRQGWRGNPRVADNWRDFRRDRRQDNRAFRQDRRGDRRDFRAGRVTRPEFRAERRADRRAYRQEYRRDARQFRRENRVERRGNRRPR